jgi:hypothetical protein
MKPDFTMNLQVPRLKATVAHHIGFEVVHEYLRMNRQQKRVQEREDWRNSPEYDANIRREEGDRRDATGEMRKSTHEIKESE